MTRPLSVRAVATGGSSGRTFARIESVLREAHPDLRMTIAGTQPLNLRQPGATAYSGQGTVVSVDQQATGLPTLAPHKKIALQFAPALPDKTSHHCITTV
ncbi:hypothetical protein [Xanthobacter tagetidis]|uniref:hypothetical protein n=1 Tax=Xanthobacter tagetidis TaxID=60216 RepID=UPI0011C3C6B4|nr:hypothetical protein [Xanthobacter tagetidis]MBB6307566.1 hypothetical protein [Xanthobacter tagetidis]